MATETIFWLGFFVFLVVVELLTMGLTTIWFAGGALVAVAASLLNADLTIQITVFAVVSILLLIFTRPFAMKYVNKNRTRTNADSLIGKTAIVTEDIDNLLSKGQVQVGGQIWTARAVDDQTKLAAGSKVDIREIRGVKLIVKPK